LFQKNRSKIYEFEKNRPNEFQITSTILSKFPKNIFLKI